MTQFIHWFDTLSMNNLLEVGGKNASLGEMISQLSQMQVKVPNGFATSVFAYEAFLEENHLNDFIRSRLDGLDPNNLQALQSNAKAIRESILQSKFNPEFIENISAAYKQLATAEQSVAVRSSATAEDLPQASFAGQQETFLNVKGVEAVLDSIKAVYASLFNDRAISYRQQHGFSHEQVKISAGVQLMVRSDLAASGVMFTLDPESGRDNVIFITSSYGLGESIVQGAVNPDEFYLYKPHAMQKQSAIIQRRLGTKQLKMIYADEGIQTEAVPLDLQNRFSIDDNDLMQLAEYAKIIEDHYQRPMDIEWAKDGVTGALYIVQARPETVQTHQSQLQFERYQIKSHGLKALVEGRSVGSRIAQGPVRILQSLDAMHSFQAGEVLVADMTDPDWEPVMAQAAAIVTNRGGRTCHAAIIARELGIPAVVGCGNATDRLSDGAEVTVSCAEGDTAYVYPGKLDFSVKQIDLNQKPDLPVNIMMNLGNPNKALEYSKLPHEGVGLARLEFIISHSIGIHPQALLDYDTLSLDLQKSIDEKTMAYGAVPINFYIEKITESISTIAAAFYPKPVIVRFSDFKSNEYASLLGGDLYEPKEENPMIGFRGASRYLSPQFKAAFALECQAVKKAREDFDNIKVMVPFVRTVEEAKGVVDLLAEFGLKSGEANLAIYMMCELPSNALLADEFLQYFDGYSIGSNDLTQLTLGLDRDSAFIAQQFDERNEAVKALMQMAIKACLDRGKYIGICGQGPSDHPDLFEWLLKQGISSLSLNPDSILPMYLRYSGQTFD